MRTLVRLSISSVLALSAACANTAAPLPPTSDPSASPPAPHDTTTPANPASPSTTPANPAQAPSQMTMPTQPAPVSDPGTRVVLSAASSATAELQQLSAAADAQRKLSAAELRAQHALTHPSELGYDPKQAQGLSVLQKSTLALDADELTALGKNGFVVSARQQFPTMLYGYAAIYVQDLPLFVSADSILDAVYRSYDSMLEDTETNALMPALTRLLDGMRAGLAAAPAADSVKRDVDVYLAVAKSLLQDSVAAPFAGASADDISKLYQAAQAAGGAANVELFGTTRAVDFSQFKPRGHYTDTPELQRYFRAMIWLGRVEMRLIETLPKGELVFRRAQLDAAMLLGRLVKATGTSDFERIDDTIQAFVGVSDYMRVPELDALLHDLGVNDASELAQLDDQRIAQTILDRSYGVQLIASQIMVNDTTDGHTLPLDRSFALLGQRYVIDSHVFSNLVYDRVPDRLMPNPLDVAFAALGNDAALEDLGPELDGYSGALAATRSLVDDHPDSFWNVNLYNTWLSALRALSPAKDAGDPKAHGMPVLTATKAWNDRLLNTQLASWAQLRHNTVLYAKQSFTSGPGCVYPDAYVEPYPEFYAALGRFAERGLALALTLTGGGGEASLTRLNAYFSNLQRVSSVLGAMANEQRMGQSYTADQLAFVNEAVKNRGRIGCAGPETFDGWYAKLDYDVSPEGIVSSEVKPVVADVHTQPFDEAGRDVGRILHVGTGLPRLMVVTLDDCGSSRAFVGLAASYYEQITDHWLRLTDDEWAPRVLGNGADKPAEVPWTQSFVAL